MNERDREELERLKQRQESLRLQLAQLDTHIKLLDERLDIAAKEIQPMEIAPLEISALEESPEAPPKAPVAPPSPAAIPPIIAEVMAHTAVPPALKATPEPPKPAPTLEQLLQHRVEKENVPPPLPPPNPIRLRVSPAADPLPENIKSSSSFSHSAATPPVPPIVPTVEPPKEKGSFEMRLGTYWLVRIGIFVLLTGLVFAGNYAYQNWIGLLGPAGKLSLLYFASSLLLGCGAWLQRKGQKEALKNYAQVLFAGGLAAVYFTTYAAHYIAPLRVIENPMVDGMLLLAWAGFMVWMADRKKSEVLALFSTGLAYYSSIITSIGTFTLYSNLILTVASVFFLIRNRWTTLSFGSLIATYAGFAFWRFFHHGLLWDGPLAELWKGNFFLVGYWIVFTAAVFLSRNEKLVGAARATFASLNNGAFFGLIVLSMLRIDEGNFWKFSLGFGAALLALALAARRFLADEFPLKNSYLTQGLLFLTLGFIAHYSGLQLALILAVESVVLLTVGLNQKNLILQAGAYLSAALALAWGVYDLNAGNAVIMGTGVGAFLIFNSFRSSRHNDEPQTFRPVPTYFALLGLLMWLMTTLKHAPQNWVAPALAIDAVLLTASLYVLRVREITLLAQGYLMVAQLGWLFRAMENPASKPWWNPAILIVATLGLSHWWQRQKTLENGSGGKFLQGIYALAIVGIVFHWLHPHFGPASWLAIASLLAIGITAYGVCTRAWFLAGGGQIFLAISVWEFTRQLLGAPEPDWSFALVPILTLLLTAYLTTAWLLKNVKSSSDVGESVREPLLRTSRVYRGVAVAMTLWWINEYIPLREQFWVLAALGIIIFMAGATFRNYEALFFSAVFFAAGFINFVWLPAHNGNSVYWPNLFAILTLPALQQWMKRKTNDFQLKPEFHLVMIVPASLCLWLYVSRWIFMEATGIYLAFGWTVFAVLLITAEFWLREKSYRWLGFLVLGAALIHVVFLDVWKPNVFWPNLLPVLMLLTLQQLARRFPARYGIESPWLTAMILLGGGSLWLFISRWVVLESHGHFFLTASWAVLAVAIFGAGLVLRERIYRWLGLGILGCALGRVFISDIWKLGTGYRILSFLALGVALLALGFFYNMYQEKIKEWI